MQTIQLHFSNADTSSLILNTQNYHFWGCFAKHHLKVYIADIGLSDAVKQAINLLKRTNIQLYFEFCSGAEDADIVINCNCALITKLAQPAILQNMFNKQQTLALIPANCFLGYLTRRQNSDWSIKQSIIHLNLVAIKEQQASLKLVVLHYLLNSLGMCSFSNTSSILNTFHNPKQQLSFMDYKMLSKLYDFIKVEINNKLYFARVVYYQKRRYLICSPILGLTFMPVAMSDKFASMVYSYCFSDAFFTKWLNCQTKKEQKQLISKFVLQHANKLEQIDFEQVADYNDFAKWHQNVINQDNELLNNWRNQLCDGQYYMKYNRDFFMPHNIVIETANLKDNKNKVIKAAEKAIDYWNKTKLCDLTFNKIKPCVTIKFTGDSKLLDLKKGLGRVDYQNLHIYLSPKLLHYRGYYSLAYIIAHELGHVLGLKHDPFSPLMGYVDFSEIPAENDPNNVNSQPCIEDTKALRKIIQAKKQNKFLLML